MQTPTPFKNSKFDFSKSILQQNSIDNKVKELATQVKQKPITKLTRNDLFWDAKKIVEAKWIDRKAAMTETLKYYKAKGLQVDGLDIDAQLQSMQPVVAPVQEGNTTLSSRLQGVEDKALSKAEERIWTDRNAFRVKLDNMAAKAWVLSGVIWAWVWEIFETTGQIISAITPDSIEDKIKNEAQRQFDMVTWSQLWQLQWKVIKWTASTAKEVFEVLPENVQKDLESLWTIWIGILDAIGAGYAVKWAKSAAISAKDMASKKNFLTQENREKYIAKENEKIDKIFWQVGQPWKKDLDNMGAFKASVKNIDTEDVKTYADLNDRFDDKISTLARKQDEILPSEKIYDISELTQTSKGGSITANPVSQAIDDMESLYERIGDIDALEKVRELKSSKLSVKDINNVAREYNTQFWQKAFTKTGEQKFSDIGRSFENTRKWVKDISRDLLPDDAMKLLDAEISDLYNARGISKNMVDKVEMLKNRIDERGLLASISNSAGKILDTITWWIPKELFSSMLLKWGMGKATLDSLTLQGRLAKNLKVIESSLAKIEKAKDARVVSEILEDMAKQIGLTREQINAQASELWEKIKNKAWDLADSTADKVGVRAKFMWDEGTGISGKIDDSIRKYTSDWGQQINKKIRSWKLSESDKLEIKNLDEFIENAPKNSWSSYRWRTIDESKIDSFIKDIKENWYLDTGYTSSSTNYWDATTFARNWWGKKWIILEIDSKKWALVDRKFNEFDEEEILFPRNSSFKYSDTYTWWNWTQVIVVTD
jgi:hypothetical protein